MAIVFSLHMFVVGVGAIALVGLLLWVLIA